MSHYCQSGQVTDWGADANYDLNIYDYTAWDTNSDGKESDVWRMIAYKIPDCGCSGYNKSMEESRIDLTPEESISMGLGKSTDEDFFIDKTYLVTQKFRSIPPRIQDWLDSLLPYTTPTPHLVKETN